MRYLIFLLFLLPLYCLGQSVPGCYNYVAQTPVTATSNTTISGFSIDCNGAATPGITIPAGVHDVHITKCKILNSTTANGLIYINSGCYNITIDTCFFQSGYRGIYALGATNNIHIWYNFFYNIIDPNVKVTTTDGGGSSVQLNNCTGTSIQILDNRSYHDISSSGVGDQFSLYKCTGTAASPIRICRNQALNGSTNPPSTGYAGVVAGDLGGGYQRVDSNIFVNTGAVGAQVQGGHDIEMSYNTIYLAQASYTSVAIAFGNYSGTSSSNITIANNSARCIQPSGSIFNFWFDPKTAFQPTGWSTNTTSTGLNANILPNPLWAACALTVLPPNISYSPSAYTFTMGTAVTPFTPANSGGIASFTATLPTGLTINPSTGTISGTPPGGSPPTNYTITAINTAGSSSATINIGVVSTDAALSSMILSNGTLSPTFCSCTGNYTASVANAVSSITLTPTVNQVNATVTVNGIPVTSGTASGAISLAVGTNIIRTVVTAQNGSTNTYTVTVTRAASTDATLSLLAISSGTLSPSFASGITSYAVNVGSGVSSITLTPSVNQANATVTVNGVAVVAGNASTPVSLATGSNIITSVVTAQDGSTTQTYTVTVTRPIGVATINFGALVTATYGDSPITLAATSNNTDAGATITYISSNPSVATVSGTTMTIVGAGAVNITAGEAATANFMTAQNVTQTLTVNKTDLTITAKDQHKIYGSPFVFDGTEFTQTGLVQGDAVNSVTLQSSGSDALADVGTYPITPSGATGSGLTNYNINYAPGTFTVNGVNLTFAAIPAQVYGAADFDPGATSQSTISYTSSNAAVATIVNGNIHIVGVGTSTITVTSVNVIQTQTLTVTAAPLTITANDANKTYGAILTGGNTSNAYNSSGLQNGETIGNVVIDYDTGAEADASTGTYAGSVIVLGASGGTFNPNNYSISYVPGDIIVGKAALTITASNSSKVYGATQVFAGTEFVAIGLKNGDGINGVTLTSAGAPASAPAANYAIIPSAPVPAQGTDLSNYTVQLVNGTDWVGQAVLTVTADNQSISFGNQIPALTISYSGFVNNETSESLVVSPSATTTAIPGSAVGSYPVSVGGAVDNNYAFNYMWGTLSIYAVPITFNPIVSQIYGSADFNPGATSGSPIIYTSGNTSVATILAGNIHIKSVGTTLITANNGSSTASQTLTVTPADLTITADNLSKIQGRANPVLTVSYYGLVNGDTKNNLTSQPTVTTTATTNSPEGDYPITPDNAVDANYNISYTPGTLTVTGLALTFGPIPSKTYGGADFDPGADSSSPITYTSSNTSVATIVNGYVHIVGVGSSTITANDSKTSIDQTLTITPATLSINADNQTKTYGADNPLLTISYIGFVNGENETNLSTLPAILTNADGNSAVGTYSITVNGAADPNYNIAYNNGTLTVTKAPLSINANNQSRTYGDPDPPLTVSYSGFMNNETAIGLDTQPTVSTTATINSPPGNYPITVSGAADANYNISYVQGTMTINGIALTFNPIQSQAYGSADFNAGASGGSITYTSSNLAVATIVSGNVHIVGAGTTTITANNGSTSAQQTLTVTRVPLTITANDRSKTYGSANPALTVSYNGFLNGDTPASLTTLPSIGTTALTGSPVGTYPITASGGASANYTLSYIAGTLTVGQAALTVLANDQSKIQGTANPTLTLSYSGFVNGENNSALTTQPAVITTAVTSSPIGTYPIIASGAVDANYNITYTPGTLTVTAPALTFNPIPSKVYGTADFSPGATSTSSITYTSSNTAVATIISGNIHIVGAGTSNITANDGTTSLQQTLTVTPAALTITAVNKSKTYGAANPTLTVTYSGFVNSETQTALSTLPIITTTALTGSSVGTYPISASAAAANNYSISYVAGTLTIGQASLTITAANKSKTYGAANPVLTVIYTGFVNGDTQASLTTQPTIVTTVVTGSAVGIYPITVSSASNANYSISYVAGTLTIGQAVLTITANNQTKTQGATNPALTVSYSGFVNGENNSALTTQPVVTTTATTSSPVGTYPITASGAVGANYTVSYVQGTLTVTGTALSFSPIPSKVYGTVDFNPGAVSSSSIIYTSGNTSVATIVSGNIHIVGVGISTITANDGSTILQQTLTVTPAALGITANSINKTYGSTLTGGVGSAAFTSSGLVNGETIGSVTTAYGTGSAATTAVGTYSGSVTPSAATGGTFTAGNYIITYTSNSIVVTPAALTITANNTTKTYGTVITGGTGSTAFISSGLVNGQTIGTVTIAYGTGSAATANAGTYTGAVTPSVATGGTFTASNYTITYNSGNIIVSTAALSITANNVTKTYGATLTGGTGSTAFTASGLINGQTIGSVTIAYGTGASATTAVGTYISSVTPSVATGGTFTASNYSITYNKSNITVSAAALNIIANNITKAYGSTITGGAGSTAFTATGLANGQTIGSITVAYGTGSAATTAVGTYTGSVTSSAATGGTFTSSNYIITYTTGNIVVSAATLTITASSVTKTYGAALTSGTGSTAFTSSGLVNGQTIGTVTIAYGTGSASNAAAGSYTGSVTPSAATGGTLTASNYTITYNKGNITVAKAALTITASNQTKTQGAVNPTLSVSYSGFVNSETNSVLTTQPTATTTATTSSPVGTYPITASGAAAANYIISYVAGTLTVTTPSTLTFNAIPSKVYGVVNFSPGATTTTGTITYTSSNTSVATIVSGNIHIVGIGTSTITASNGTTSLQQTLTVTKASLTITGGVTKTYGSTLTGGTGSTAFTSSGLVYSQTIGSVTNTYGTGSAATAAVGTYTGTAVPSAATGGTFVAANYTITYVNGNITVNKATLTITANNASKNYGTAITGRTGSTAFTSSGLKNGQTIGSVTIAYGTGATATSRAGSYSGSVTPSAATGGTFIAADYTISYVLGNITVSKVPLTITANNKVKIQGNTNPALTVSYSGFVNGETNAALTTQPTVTTTATTSSPVGTYPITPSGAVDANYTITYVAGTLTVNPSTAALVSVVNPLHETYAPVEEPSVRQAVSPNGDGINDILQIDNIESYPDNKVTLMNRNGTTIFQIAGYDNQGKVFDGHSNITKEMQKPGTYFYLLEYKAKGELKHKTSYFVIKY